jgi:hypothetical protein
MPLSATTELKTVKRLTSMPIEYHGYRCKMLNLKMEGLTMNDIKYPEEKKSDHVEYVLKKYLNKQLCYKAIFSQLDDGKLKRILNDIKEGV